MAPCDALAKVKVGSKAPTASAALTLSAATAMALVDTAALAASDVVVLNNAGSTVAQAVVLYATSKRLRTVCVLEERWAGRSPVAVAPPVARGVLPCGRPDAAELTEFLKKSGASAVVSAREALSPVRAVCVCVCVRACALVLVWCAHHRLPLLQSFAKTVSALGPAKLGLVSCGGKTADAVMSAVRCSPLPSSRDHCRLFV